MSTPPKFNSHPGTYTTPTIRERAREELSALEHDQWIAWSKDIARTEQITPARRERWEKLWDTYDTLTEAQKDQDREWADKVLAIVDKYITLTAEETAKAFGGCTSCYGKGYGSKTEFAGGRHYFEKLPTYVPCPECERGKQFAEVLSLTTEATREKLLEALPKGESTEIVAQLSEKSSSFWQGWNFHESETRKALTEADLTSL